MAKGTYNLHIFENLVKDIPGSRILYVAIVVGGLFYGLLATFALDNTISWQIGASFLIDFILTSVAVLILPAVLSAEIYTRMFDYMRRRWALALSFCAETVFFLFLLFVSRSDSLLEAWKIYWAGVLTVFVLTYTVLVLSARNHGFKKLGVFTLAHPVLLLLPTALIWQFEAFSRIEYITQIGLLFVTALILIALVLVHEHLMKINIETVKGFNLSSSLLQDNQEDIDAGYPANPEIYSFLIRNEDGEYSIGAPWVHPGPLGGFGGAALSEKVISRKNINGSEGFFFHLPTTHQSDPASSSCINTIYEAFEEPDTEKKASRMISRSYGGITLSGRRYGDSKVIYLETEKFDDFEKCVFSDAVDSSDTLIVDLHNHAEHEDRGLMHSGSKAAERARAAVKSFERDLENLSLHEYEAGFSVDMDGKPITAVVEKVDGQKTLLLGSDENGPCETVNAKADEVSDRFEEVKVFTTDTHEDIKDLANTEEIDEDRLFSVIQEASETLSQASAGLTSSRCRDINLLNRDYYSITHSINIITRLFPLSIIILYVSLMVWLAFA